MSTKEELAVVIGFFALSSTTPASERIIFDGQGVAQPNDVIAQATLAEPTCPQTAFYLVYYHLATIDLVAISAMDLCRIDLVVGDEVIEVSFFLFF